MKTQKLTKKQRAEQIRQKRIEESRLKAEQFRKLSLNHNGIDSKKYKHMTSAQMDAWVTKATKIKSKPQSQRKGANYKKVTGQ